jgi:hypothetical protein
MNSPQVHKSSWNAIFNLHSLDRTTAKTDHLIDKITPPSEPKPTPLPFGVTQPNLTGKKAGKDPPVLPVYMIRVTSPSPSITPLPG